MKFTNQQLITLRDRFIQRNSPNAKGEIKLPLFFNEIYNRIKNQTFNHDKIR
jgi:hypothetical protein